MPLTPEQKQMVEKDINLAYHTAQKLNKKLEPALRRRELMA